MKCYRQLVFPFLLLLILPGTVKAQAKPPTFVLSVNSINALLENVKYLASLAGQKDAVRSIEGFIQTNVGNKGLPGVDMSRPLGAYGRMGKDVGDISGALLIPISDETAFLNLLKNYNVQTIKGDGGIYTLKTPFLDAYMRFANRYAYLTALTRSALEDKNLLNPATVLAVNPTTAFSLKIQLSQIPEDVKKLPMAQAEQVLQELQAKGFPGASKGQKDFFEASLTEVTKIIAAVLKDGREMNVDVDFNQKTGDVAATISVSGVPGSELATGIQMLAKNPSLFVGLLKQDALFNSVGHLKLSAPLVKALSGMVGEVREMALANLKDEAKKQKADALCKGILPTFNSGDFDGALVLAGTGPPYTLVAATKVKDGTALGKIVHDLLGDASKDLPPGKNDKIKVDADAVGAVKIHKIELAELDATARMLEPLLGEPNLYLAFRNDALFLTAGRDGLQEIKSALTTPAAPSNLMLYYEVDMARLMVLAPKEQADLARKVFPTGQGGTVRLSVTTGEAITLRFSTKLSVLQLFGAIREAKGI